MDYLMQLIDSIKLLFKSQFFSLQKCIHGNIKDNPFQFHVESMGGSNNCQCDCRQTNKVGVITLLGFKLYIQAKAVKTAQ